MAATRLDPRQAAVRAVPRSYRLAVASRAVAAGLGGYVFGALLAAALALMLPLARADAALAATMLGFVGWACVALYAFAAVSARRVWTVLGVASGLCLLALLLARLGGEA